MQRRLYSESSKGYKDLNENDWIFKVHWENDPNLPGMLQIEALVQMSSLQFLHSQVIKEKLCILRLQIILNS